MKVRMMAVVAVGQMIVAACAPGDDTSMPDVFSLSGRVLTDSFRLGYPEAMFLSGDNLILLDSRGDYAIQVYDTTGAHRRSLGRKGAGPGEFTAPRGVTRDRTDPSRMWVFDVALRRLTPVDLAGILPGTEDETPFGPAVTLGGMIPVGTPQWINDATLVGLNSMLSPTDNRFTLFGTDGEIKATRGSPPPTVGQLSPFLRQQIYGGGGGAVHPDSQWLVLASLYAPRLEILDGGLLTKALMAVPVSFDPDFSAAPDGLNLIRGAGFRFGYIDVAVTRNLVYALFSGRGAEYPAARQPLGDEVHVFTWTGTLRTVLRLDGEMAALTVTPDDETLFAARVDPFPQVVTYVLPPVLAAEGNPLHE